MSAGDVLLFNPDGRWEEWPFTPKIGEQVQITNSYPRRDHEGKIDGELVDFVSLETGAMYQRFSVNWFAPKQTDEPF